MEDKVLAAGSVLPIRLHPAGESRCQSWSAARHRWCARLVVGGRRMVRRPLQGQSGAPLSRQPYAVSAPPQLVLPHCPLLLDSARCKSLVVAKDETVSSCDRASGMWMSNPQHSFPSGPTLTLRAMFQLPVCMEIKVDVLVPHWQTLTLQGGS